VVSIEPATALVLRDRTNADAQHVFATALDDLIALGAWTHRRVRRLPSLRLTDALTPAAEALDLPEPLRTTDAILRRAATDLGVPLRTARLGAWLALHAEGAPSTAVKRTIEALVAAGLLERPRPGALGPSAAGAAVLAEQQPPQQPSPLGARLLDAIKATATGAHGFAYDAIGAEVSGYGHSPNGDNRAAAVHQGQRSSW
jgi:hypothetical protein